MTSATIEFNTRMLEDSSRTEFAGGENGDFREAASEGLRSLAELTGHPIEYLLDLVADEKRSLNELFENGKLVRVSSGRKRTVEGSEGKTNGNNVPNRSRPEGGSLSRTEYRATDPHADFRMMGKDALRLTMAMKYPKVETRQRISGRKALLLTPRERWPWWMK